MTEPTIITTEPERRQIARVLEFSAQLASHINWESIAQTARELNANFEARRKANDSMGVTIFWAYRDDEQ